LQVASAVSSVINGGMLVKPTLIKGDTPPEESEIRVVRKETSLKLRQLMRLVVTDGTGGNAEVLGYNVGGKTGTADKSINGRYVKGKRISSFVAAFPINDPRYVVYVMIDEPNPNKNSYGYATAGWVAAPAIKRIISTMAPLLNMEPVKNQVDLAEPLRQFVQVEAKEN
jgi:cell division protein FtsI (penicillin-binding protein 3)